MYRSNSRHSMPGAFTFDSQQDNGYPSRLPGANSHIYQPPQTPSTSAASSFYLTPSIEDRPVAGTRKRSRNDFNGSTPVMDELSSKSVAMADPGSPMPFVNTRYKIAGGMDTPSWAAESASFDCGNDDLGYRSDRTGFSRQNTLMDSEFTYFPSTDGSGRLRMMDTSMHDTEPGSWTLTKIVGGVVGKVWEFCKTSAFRGFHAGGGKGYDIDTKYSTFRPTESESMWDEKAENSGAPIPGAWDGIGEGELNFIPDYMDRAVPEGTPPRAGKRRQVCTPNDDLNNWVVVPPTSVTPSKSYLKAPARYSLPTTSSNSRRLIGRPTALPRPSMLPRRPIQHSRGSHAGSATLQAGSVASFASPRSPGHSRIPIQQSSSPVRPPESPAARKAAEEAQRWAAVRRREDREAEESMQRLDRQLKAMIREGKEALGTRISIEDEAEPGNSRKWNI